jgi:hypothetical protein
MDFVALAKESPLTIVVVFILAAFWVWAEKRLTDLAAKQGQLFQNNLDIATEISRTSLDVKSQLRQEERSALVAFRVALVEWEDFIQNAVGTFSMSDPADTKVIRKLAQRDQKIFLAVKESLVKAIAYLRDQQLEDQMMGVVVQARMIYYPVLNMAVMQLIDARQALVDFDIKLQRSSIAGVAPTQADRRERDRLEQAVTDVLATTSKEYIDRYPAFAQKLEELKRGINYYIYRPIESTSIDQD